MVYTRRMTQEQKHEIMCREVQAILSREADVIDPNVVTSAIVRWHMERVARLGGLREVSEGLRKSRQHTWNLAHKEGFPEPVHTVAASPLWDIEDVKAYIAHRGAAK